MPEFILVDDDDEVYYLHSDPFADDVHMITDNEPFYSNKIFSHSELNYHRSLLTVTQ